jgi:ComF family protein
MIDLIFPPHCSGCGILGYRWCKDCDSLVKKLSPPYCQKCGSPEKFSNIAKDHCLDILQSIDFIRSYSIYEPPLSNAIKKLKYQNDIGIAQVLAFYLVEMYNDLILDTDFVIPVPLGKNRFKERGYNQASLIAKPFSLVIGRPMKTQALFRYKETKSQVGLSREERSANVTGAFTVDNSNLLGKNIILIDDVTTTGSTLEACARELKNKGANNIVGLTIAMAVKTKDGFSDFVSNQEITKS